MTIRVVGAGLGRTGTHSLKVALERLLGGPCYHMIEVLGHPDHVPFWHEAMTGHEVDWPALFDGYVATVDWPGAAVWREIAASFPEAKVLLSTRSSTDQWWTSASRTIFEAMGGPGSDQDAWRAMTKAMMGRLTPDWQDETGAKAAYERHNAAVRAEVPPERLIDWQPSDGWGPLCAALDLAVPADPFPVTNTTSDFRAMAGLDRTP